MRTDTECEPFVEAVEVGEWRRKLEGKADAELREELSGDETSAELRELVEEIMEDQQRTRTMTNRATADLRGGIRARSEDFSWVPSAICLQEVRKSISNIRVDDY